MVRLGIALALIGLAYWYWTETQPKSLVASEAARLEENAAVIQRCMNQDERMEATGGLGGVAEVGSGGNDAEKFCADKNHLFKRDGHWYRSED